MNIWSRLAGGINLQDGSKGSHILAFTSLYGLFPQWTGMTFVTNKIIPQQWQTITSKVRTSKKCWYVLLLHLQVDSTTLEKFLPTNTNLLDIGVGYLGNVSQPSDFFKWLWSLLAQEVGTTLGLCGIHTNQKVFLPTVASWHWTFYLPRTMSQINLNSL